mmetsp:Transcript_37861/g.88912  ORF Transcript_37861/g.88912 Transcript_37861/m.88912 type:complete len:84 (+) Transcript_37861:264-515(+)
MSRQMLSSRICSKRTGPRGHHRCTVLTVAHCLSTILDYDRILVLNKGEVVEFDAPAELLSRPGGHFASMAKETMPEKFTKASL